MAVYQEGHRVALPGPASLNSLAEERQHLRLLGYNQGHAAVHNSHTDDLEPRDEQDTQAGDIRGVNTM